MKIICQDKSHAKYHLSSKKSNSIFVNLSEKERKKYISSPVQSTLYSSSVNGIERIAGRPKTTIFDSKYEAKEFKVGDLWIS